VLEVVKSFTSMVCAGSGSGRFGTDLSTTEPPVEGLLFALDKGTLQQLPMVSCQGLTELSAPLELGSLGAPVYDLAGYLDN
jgi:hypothetical protein